MEVPEYVRPTFSMSLSRQLIMWLCCSHIVDESHSQIRSLGKLRILVKVLLLADPPPPPDLPATPLQNVLQPQNTVIYARGCLLIVLNKDSVSDN